MNENVKFVNLTAHQINVITPSGVITIPPSGDIARCAEVSAKVEEINGIPVYVTEYGEVEGLPKPKSGTYYVVSALVRQAVRNRHDVLSPGPLLRNAAGQILGCDGFVRN